MLVLNNQRGNHLKTLKTLFDDAEEVVITSPFLMEDLTIFFSEVFGNNLKKITLYTSLKPTLPQLNKNVNAIESLKNYAFNHKNLSFSVKAVDGLHGKAYLAYKNENLYQAIISSANLTNYGLSKNHEWGVWIEEPEDLKQLAEEISRLEAKPIDEDKVIKLLDRIDKYDIPSTEKSVNNINISDIIDPNVFEEIENQIWLKPIGSSDSPISENETFSDLNPSLHFSKRRPTGVQIGDLLIAYGVGVRSLLSVYKVTSEPKYISKEDIKAGFKERWPWYVFGKNLTPEFGANWWRYNLKLNEVTNEYLSKFPEKPITHVGTQTYGAFNYGADKLHLDNEFGNWLYNKVFKQISG